MTITKISLARVSVVSRVEATGALCYRKSSFMHYKIQFYFYKCLLSGRPLPLPSAILSISSLLVNISYTNVHVYFCVACVHLFYMLSICCVSISTHADNLNDYSAMWKLPDISVLSIAHLK